jgi:putative spermidine/putrescine transport system permease protein
MNRLGLKAVCFLLALWLVLPVLIVIPLSFTATKSFVFPPTGVSTRWYESFLTNPDWVNVTYNSIAISLASAAVATFVGTTAALAARGMSGLARGVLFAVVAMPLIIPGVFLALADFFVLLETGLVGTHVGFVLADSVLALPLVFIPVSAALANFDRSLELASASLGADRWTTFRSVTLPLILPGVVAGAMFALVTAWDEVLIALFISSPELTTLPVRLYQSVSVSTDPTLAAVSSLTVLFVVLVVFGIALRRIIRLRSNRVSV